MLYLVVRSLLNRPRWYMPRVRAVTVRRDRCAAYTEISQQKILTMPIFSAVIYTDERFRFQYAGDNTRRSSAGTSIAKAWDVAVRCDMAVTNGTL